MELIVGWLAFSVLVAFLAGSRGRNHFFWLVLSLALSPLISGILLLILPKIGDVVPLRDELGEAITPQSHVKCPDCRELVRHDARKCKHCGTALVPQ